MEYIGTGVEARVAATLRGADRKSKAVIDDSLVG
jgi:hypothetical protein